MEKYIGKKLDGRYEIKELIGIGGMAEVYKAEDLLEKRPVAVKILKNEFAGNDDFVRRFRNESKAIAVLSHPNIVKIYDVGFSDKIQYIVMEYIDGITLKEFMEQQGVLKWKDSVHFIIQILRALQHAHDRGIVHRDIKPQNIMIFPGGDIKVMDFGIARFAREEGKTISDKAIGSVHYISPEQARGDITDEKSDIYSVGVMLYEMLTGVKPFDADTPIAVALMHMQSSAKPPRAVNPTIPEGLEAIVMRAMQRDASKRYQSASEMIKDIEELRSNPSAMFEYNFGSDDADGTKYFEKPVVSETAPEKKRDNSPAEKKPAKKASKNEVKTTKSPKVKDYDNDYDDDDEEEEVSKSSYFVVALTAIAAAVVIMAVVFIAVMVIGGFGHTGVQQSEPMVNLVGYDYNTCKSTYADYFELVVESEKYSSEYPEGTIISHTPKEGSPIIVGNSQVKAVVSKGPRMVNVPNVYTLEASAATNMMKTSGLEVSIVMQNSDAQKNTVIKTEPERNSEAEIGSTVIIYVSLGPEIYDVVMPELVGMKKAEAVANLESKGFEVQLQEQDSVEEKDTIIAQSIPHLNEDGQANIVSPNQLVVLTYSSGVIPMTELNITFAVPDGLRGKAVFNAYVNGNLSGTLSVDNIGYVSTISVPIEGKDTQKVVLETVSDGETYIIGEYNVDFNNKQVSELKFDRDLLRQIYEIPPETTVTEPEPEETTKKPNDEPVAVEPPMETEAAGEYDPIIIGTGDYDGWWDSILNGR